jgi:hypothetical protein
MLSIKINDVEYSLKQNLKEITIKEYFDIMKIQSKRCEIPVKEADKFKDGTYDIQYYESGKEPLEFVWDINAELINILSYIPIDILKQSPEISTELLQYVDDFTDDTSVWKSKPITKTITEKVLVSDKKHKFVETIVNTDYNWVYDEPSDWCFQQWVDSENATKQKLYYPFLMCLYKQKNGSKTKRLYSRAHKDFDEKEAYWLEQPAYGNINTIISVLNKMSEVRNLFYWIYEARSKFTEKEKPTQKIYSEFSGWNDVVVSLSECNAFNSSKGTLYAVRNANCVEVLEYLNWKRGKAFAEYEDYKIEEQNSKFQNIIG